MKKTEYPQHLLTVAEWLYHFKPPNFTSKEAHPLFHELYERLLDAAILRCVSFFPTPLALGGRYLTFPLSANRYSTSGGAVFMFFFKNERRRGARAEISPA